MKRIFSAFEVPETVRAAVNRHIQYLRRKFPDLKGSWEKPHKMHVTLRFFGEVGADQLETIYDCARAAAETCPPFSVVVGKPGKFSRKGSPSVLWIGLDDATSGFQGVKAAFERLLEEAGFERDRRRYSPHLTVARLRDPLLSRTVAREHLAKSVEPVRFDIDAIEIIESVLKPTGSEYTVLKKFDLAET